MNGRSKSWSHKLTSSGFRMFSWLKVYWLGNKFTGNRQTLKVMWKRVTAARYYQKGLKFLWSSIRMLFRKTLIVRWTREKRAHLFRILGNKARQSIRYLARRSRLRRLNSLCHRLLTLIGTWKKYWKHWTTIKNTLTLLESRHLVTQISKWPSKPKMKGDQPIISWTKWDNGKLMQRNLLICQSSKSSPLKSMHTITWVKDHSSSSSQKVVTPWSNCQKRSRASSPPCQPTLWWPTHSNQPWSDISSEQSTVSGTL